MPRLLALLLLLIAACDRGDALVVGTEPEFPPFESKNEKGEFVGFDMDLVRALAKHLGRDLEIREMSFDSLPTAVQNGSIDIIASGMTADAERAKTLAFSDPYFHTVLCLLVNKDAGIGKPDDADGKPIVVKLGTTGANLAPKRFPNSEITTLESEGACALEVVQGRAAAFVYDRHSIRRHADAHPKTTKAVLDPLSSEPYALAMKKGNEEFVKKVNAFLKEFRKSGEYATLYKKHFGTAPPDDDTD